MRLIALAGAVAAWFPLAAAAQVCPGARVALLGAGWRPEVARQLEADLQVELRRTGLCVPLPDQPIPQIEGVWNPDQPIVLTVGFLEGQTETVLRRRLNASELPDDALALSLAAVSGELLEEARLHLRPPVEPEAPARRFALVARLAGEGFTQGHYQGGADVALRAGGGRLFVELAVGGRAALPVRAAEGTVTAAALWAALGVGLRLLRGRAISLAVEADLMAGPTWLQATAEPGFTARGVTGWAVAAGAALCGELMLERTVWQLRLGAGAPLRGFKVLETGQGIGGATVFLSVGGGVGL